ncbi:MAG TPA: hypothetical protein VGH14_05260 [Solirubrobacterales bacterium]
MATALALLVLAPSALASSHHPTGEFSQFGECPLSNATLENCVYSLSNGGAFTVGSKTVPLVNPVTLQGGYSGAGENVQFVGAENGETLSKTPQPVPGGLLGVTAPTWWPIWVQSWFNNLINEGFTGVTATVELARPASEIKLSTENLLTRTGTALGLPVKIKLSNAILGSNCYIGSSSSPVQLKFTTGKSGSLEGAVGNVEFNSEFTLVTISGGKLVDGTFAAPAASGCAGIFSVFVDPLVNSILGLPAGSGKNSAVLEGVLKSANANAVRASE